MAASRPDAIHREYVDPGVGLLDFQCRKVATAIGLGSRTTSFTRLLKRMYRLFRDKDCLLLEINPFIETEDGELVALDAKMSFDDNALFRQGAVAELRDFEEEDPKEVEASGHGLNYIALDGNVGCIVNGAGLAMGTMDAIAHHGGRPANFLDVGGGASPEKIANAFRIVLKDPNVRTRPGEHLRRASTGATGSRRASCRRHARLDRGARDRPAGRNQRGGGTHDPRRRAASS